MATLISAYTPDESKKASVLTGKPNRVTVEVEDNIDRDFWRDLLSDLCPEKELHFNCYQTIVKGKDVVLVKGKARIIKMADTLNDYHIGCVDSDYDWLLSDCTEDSKVITGNKYQKSVSSDNAYLFVRGHELFDHLLNSVLGPMMTELRQQHYKKLQDSDLDSENRKSTLRAYQAKDGSIKHLLSHNYRYKGRIDLYDKIVQDVSLIW